MSKEKHNGWLIFDGDEGNSHWKISDKDEGYYTWKISDKDEGYCTWKTADIDTRYCTWLFVDRNDEQEESWGKQYWKIAQKMDEDIHIIRSKDQSDQGKMTAVDSLREILVKCIKDENLDDLTTIYRYKIADNVLGYDTVAVSIFKEEMLKKYPKPKSKKKRRPSKDKNDETLEIRYRFIARTMNDAILTIRTPQKNSETKMYAAIILREQLQECVEDENLSDLTTIYKDTETDDNILGYDTQAVEKFVEKMCEKFLKP